MIRKTALTFTLVALTLNGAVVIDNSKVLGGNPFLWRDAVDVSTNPNSPAYFSFEQTIAVPITTVVAADVASSSGAWARSLFRSLGS